MTLTFLCWLLNCLLALLCVAFFTLFERNVIGLFHSRVGPNNVSFVGLTQPLLDAFNLLSKQTLIPLSVNNTAYSLFPGFSLFAVMLIWVACPFTFVLLSTSFSFLFMFCVSSCLVFGVLLSGWSSSSNYSLIGSLRSVAQSISYEAVFSTLLVLLVFISSSYSVRAYFHYSSLFVMLVLLVWVICVLAETHRAPFDFSESESELVSGFNTEYSGLNFAFIFLSEYIILIFFSVVTSCIFIAGLMPSNWLGGSVLFLNSIAILYMFIWVRITFCRFRYDLLMGFAWNVLLPVSLLFLFVLASTIAV